MGYRLAYIGNHAVSHSTETHVALSLEAEGHTVVRLQEDETDTAQVLEGRPDMVWWTRTWDRPQLDDLPARAREAGVPTVGFHLDIWHGLPRQAVIDTEAFFTVDYLYTADGDHEDAWPHNNHRWSRPGMVHTEIGAGNRRSEFQVDVAFVGNWQTYHPEWQWRRHMVAKLKRRYRSKFRWWPRGRGAVRGRDLNDLYASVSVVVGDSIFADTSTRYVSDRPYETVGRGGVLVMPDIPVLRDDFEDGEHLVLFKPGDLDDLYAKIDSLLKDPGWRQRIREAGPRHVAAHHTYRHRVAAIIEQVENEDGRLSRWRGPSDSHIDSIVQEVYTEDVYRAAPHLAGGTVVDLGANVGVWSRWAADRGCTVVAVEPNRDCADVWRQQMGDSHTLHVAGVADRTGTGVLHVDGHPGDGWVDPDREGDIPLVTLDSILEPLDTVDVLKVDIEGAEYQALSASTLLHKCRYITVELHGPGLLDGRAHMLDLPRDLGMLIVRLSRTHHVELMGDATVGGFLYCQRHQ